MQEEIADNVLDDILGSSSYIIDKKKNFETIQKKDNNPSTILEHKNSSEGTNTHTKANNVDNNKSQGSDSITTTKELSINVRQHDNELKGNDIL